MYFLMYATCNILFESTFSCYMSGVAISPPFICFISVADPFRASSTELQWYITAKIAKPLGLKLVKVRRPTMPSYPIHGPFSQ